MNCCLSGGNGNGYIKQLYSGICNPAYNLDIDVFKKEYASPLCLVMSALRKQESWFAFKIE